MFETRTFSGQGLIVSPPISGKFWCMGSSNSNQNNYFVFDSSGRITGLENAEEKYWCIEQHKLLVLDENKEIIWKSIKLTKKPEGFLEIITESLKNPGHHEILTEVSKPFLSQSKKEQEKPNSDQMSVLSESEFLFPSDLEQQPVAIERVLMLGSALGGFLYNKWQQLIEAVQFNCLAYEWAGQLSGILEETLKNHYDVLILQLPLRGILGDDCIFAEKFSEKGFAEHIYNRACNIIDQMLEEVIPLANQSDIPVLVALFMVPQERGFKALRNADCMDDISVIVEKINGYIRNKIIEHKDSYIFDINSISSSIGKRYLMDEFIYFYTQNAVFYQDTDDLGIVPSDLFNNYFPSQSDVFAQVLWQHVVATMRTIREVDAVRLVVFDADNTLWRGMACVDYDGDKTGYRRDGWPTGLWEAIHILKLRGIKVALCPSANALPEPSLWEKIVEPHFLGLHDFFILPDADTDADFLRNLPKLCERCGIAEEQVVYVTGNVTALHMMEKELPKIRVIGTNPYLTRRILLWAPELQVAGDRNPQVHDNSASSEQGVSDKKDIKVEQQEVSNPDFKKAGILNFRGYKVKIIDVPHQDVWIEVKRKYPELFDDEESNSFSCDSNKLNNYLESGGRICLVWVKDRFVDYGLSAVVFIRGNRIEGFELSSHLAGMGLEEYIVVKIVSNLRNVDGFKEIEAVTKEITLQEIYVRLGFKKNQSISDEVIFVLEPKVSLVTPQHIEDF